MRIILLLTLCFFQVFNAIAQQEDYLLKWQKGKDLKWDDFKGTPDPTDRVHAAVTYAGIEVDIIDVEFLSGSATFKARGVFDQKQSWVHPDRKDPRVLRHEQLHFDIAEVYARKLQQKLNSSNLKVKDKARVKKLRQLYTQTQLATQAKFDEETVHGLDTEKEEIWRKMIDRELQKSSKNLEIRPHYILSQN